MRVNALSRAFEQEFLKYNIPYKVFGGFKFFDRKEIKDLINDNDEVIVNYCDFGTYWDYEDFLKHTRNRNADGAIPSYKGFHPHMLGKINYAFMRDENVDLIPTSKAVFCLFLTYI